MGKEKTQKLKEGNEIIKVNLFHGDKCIKLISVHCNHFLRLSSHHWETEDGKTQSQPHRCLSGQDQPSCDATPS